MPETEKSPKSSDLLKNILLSIFTAVLTTLLGLFVWKYQDSSNKKQILYEHKLTSMDKFISAADHMILYLRFMDKIHLEEVQIETKMLNGNDITRPFDNSKLISDSQRLVINKVLENKYPYEFKAYREASMYEGEFRSNFYSAKNFFSDTTAKKMMQFFYKMDPGQIDTVVMGILKKSSGLNIYKIQDGNIDSILLTQRRTKLTNIIIAMKKELND